MNNLFKLEKLDDFKEKLEEILNGLYNSVDDTSHAVKEEIKCVLLETKFQVTEIEELFLSKGFEKDRVKYFLTLLESLKNKLFYLAITNHNSSYGEVVLNYDWALKLVCGTSELQTMKYPVLQLAINSYNTTKPVKKIYELKKDSLMKLINCLDALDLSTH